MQSFTRGINRGPTLLQCLCLFCLPEHVEIGLVRPQVRAIRRRVLLPPHCCLLAIVARDGLAPEQQAGSEWRPIRNRMHSVETKTNHLVPSEKGNLFKKVQRPNTVPSTGKGSRKYFHLIRLTKRRRIIRVDGKRKDLSVGGVSLLIENDATGKGTRRWTCGGWGGG